MRVGIAPWLATLTIWEVFIRTTDCEVHNDVELSVEGSSVGLSFPRVCETCREISFFEEAFSSEINFKDLFGWVINVSVKTVLVPVESIFVESVSE